MPPKGVGAFALGKGQLIFPVGVEAIGVEAENASQRRNGIFDGLGAFSSEELINHFGRGVRPLRQLCWKQRQTAQAFSENVFERVFERWSWGSHSP